MIRGRGAGIVAPAADAIVNLKLHSLARIKKKNILYPSGKKKHAFFVFAKTSSR